MKTLQEQLIEIKLSIIENATDSLFMRDSNTTVCEELDNILAMLGIDDETLEDHYHDAWRDVV